MKLKPEQQDIASWLAARTEAFVFVPVGFGKTIITLTAFMEMRDVYSTGTEFDDRVPSATGDGLDTRDSVGGLLDGESVQGLHGQSRLWRALVISTKNIVEHTWGQEIEHWGLPLSYASAVGRNTASVESTPDVLGLNFENVIWFFDLVDEDPSLLPDVLVIDESSKMKASSSQRVRRLIGQRRRNDPPGWERGYVHRFKRRIALSATPAPEGYEGLWSQEACVSPRRRLGQNISHFRGQFCEANFLGSGIKTYRVTSAGEERIEALIDPITYTIRAHNFLDLPDPVDVAVRIPWTQEALNEYEEMEEHAVLLLNGEEDLDLDTIDLENPEDVAVAANAAVVLNKLRQVCSGFVYNDAGGTHWLADPDAKIAALADLFERTGDSTMVVFTQFTAETDAIRDHFGGDVHVGLPETLDDWSAGRGPRMLCLHPRSAGHGINLQYGSSQICFYSLPWSREEYEQGIGRLHRRGQTQPVTVHRLMRPASVEGDVWAKLRTKGMKLQQLLERVGRRRA